MTSDMSLTIFNNGASRYTNSKKCYFVDLPLEVKYLISSALLPIPKEIELNQIPPPVTITHRLSPLSFTCRSVREDIIAWYARVRDNYGFIHTNRFGAIIPRSTSFSLTIMNTRDSAAITCPKGTWTPPATCTAPTCPAVLLDRFESFSKRDFDLIQRLDILLIGSHARVHNLRALEIVRTSFRFLEILNVYVSLELDDTDFHVLDSVWNLSPIKESRCIPCGRKLGDLLYKDVHFTLSSLDYDPAINCICRSKLRTEEDTPDCDNPSCHAMFFKRLEDWTTTDYAVVRRLKLVLQIRKDDIPLSEYNYRLIQFVNRMHNIDEFEIYVCAPAGFDPVDKLFVYDDWKDHPHLGPIPIGWGLHGGDTTPRSTNLGRNYFWHQRPSLTCP